jgi:hypothetical protein
MAPFLMGNATTINLNVEAFAGHISHANVKSSFVYMKFQHATNQMEKSSRPISRIKFMLRYQMKKNARTQVHMHVPLMQSHA